MNAYFLGNGGAFHSLFGLIFADFHPKNTKQGHYITIGGGNPQNL